MIKRFETGEKGSDVIKMMIRANCIKVTDGHTDTYKTG